MISKITILGAGESGIGAALLGKSRGYKVFVSDNGNINSSLIEEMDSNKIDYEQNVHSEEKILASDLVIKSPGIPNSSPVKSGGSKSSSLFTSCQWSLRFCQ